MKYYFAPLQGVTGYIYRNAYQTYFGQIDKYFTPFISPTSSKSLTTRELKDILPEHNEGVPVIPQILTNNAEYFLDTIDKLTQLGYHEVNLNLGCPSGTVVSKNKGSGFLAQRQKIDEFLEEVFSRVSVKVSIKTRIGKDSPEEFPEIIEVYNKYPLEELIIHPRIQKDFYGNTPNMEVFTAALASSKNPVCYNGDIFIFEDYKNLTEKHTNLGAVMLGRGLITNPALLGQIKGNPIIDKKLLKLFHDEVYKGYRETISEERNVLFKMKEFWFYMINLFADREKYAKKIRKTDRFSDYETIISRLFQELEVDEIHLLKQ